MLARRIHTALVLLMLQPAVYAQDENVYKDMSLEELADVDLVVTASKKLEDLFETPLSVTIIKRADIEKSGATSIPEALRMAPVSLFASRLPACMMSICAVSTMSPSIQRCRFPPAPLPWS